MKILVTGIAGFIGFHITAKLLDKDSDIQIIGLDNINTYYDPELKFGRLAKLGFSAENILPGTTVRSTVYDNLSFLRLELTDKAAIMELFRTENFDLICHMAAQAGVRYSLDRPDTYIESNITGFLNLLEACRHFPVKHLVYASSSSVYGLSDHTPFSEDDNTDRPESLYAATKKSNELMAHAYSQLYGIPVTGLRFFTVYGPWGRPDMAPFLFTDAIANGKPIRVFNNGNMWRDFTYIDDIVHAVIQVLYGVPTPADSYYNLYNIGNSQPVKLLDFIEEIESALEKEAKKTFLPMQPGDVVKTHADTTKLEKAIGFRPQTSIREGVKRFVDWYKEFYLV